MPLVQSNTYRNLSLLAVAAAAAAEDASTDSTGTTRTTSTASSSTSSYCSSSPSSTFSLPDGGHGFLPAKDNESAVTDDTEDDDDGMFADRSLALAIAARYTPDPSLCVHSIITRLRVGPCRQCHGHGRWLGWIYRCVQCGYRVCHNCRPRLAERCWGSISEVVGSPAAAVDDDGPGKRDSRRVSTPGDFQEADDTVNLEHESTLMQLWKSMGGACPVLSPKRQAA